jgi:hypothetical protein
MDQDRCAEDVSLARVEIEVRACDLVREVPKRVEVAYVVEGEIGKISPNLSCKEFGALSERFE